MTPHGPEDGRLDLGTLAALVGFIALVVAAALSGCDPPGAVGDEWTDRIKSRPPAMWPADESGGRDDK